MNYSYLPRDADVDEVIFVFQTIHTKFSITKCRLDFDYVVNVGQSSLFVV